MEKQKKDVVYNTKRNRFSENFKRRVLLEFSKGKSPNEALSVFGYDANKFNNNDKKYSSKLIHKWHKELYKNREILFNSWKNIKNTDLQYEINSMADDDEKDFINTYVFEKQEKLNNLLKEKGLL